MNPSTTSTRQATERVFPAQVPGAGPLVRGARLELLRGMLSRLIDATPGGQHYLMAKILPLLRREALEPSPRFRPNQRHLIMRSLDELEHEAGRVAPDPGIFDRKAQVLVDVFALA